VLGRLLNSAVMAGKFVRSETEIAKGAVSISSAAVELAVMKVPEDLGMPLAEARVCVIGAGKMSKLLLTHLESHGVTKVTAPPSEMPPPRYSRSSLRLRALPHPPWCCGCSPWPIQDILSLVFVCARINHPFIIPAH